MRVEPSVQQPPRSRPFVGCEHGAACHAGLEPAVGTAPEQARSWLLIEFDGPWPADETEAALPGLLGKLAVRGAALGVRVLLIRRPVRRRARAGEGESLVGSVFVGWAAGPAPWLRRGDAAQA